MAAANHGYNGSELIDNRSSRITGNNKSPFGSWKIGNVYSAPFYAGYRSGSNVFRFGFSARSVQDIQQNVTHKYGFLFTGIGRQNYYLDYLFF